MNDFEEMIEQSREAALADNGESNDEEYISDIMPCVTVTLDRVYELNDAIARHINDSQLTRKKMVPLLIWARELYEQLDLLDTMLIYTR